MRLLRWNKNKSPKEEGRLDARLDASARAGTLVYGDRACVASWLERRCLVVV